MRQEIEGGQEREVAGRSGKRRVANGVQQRSVATMAPAPERYLDRHTPGIFAKWWAGMVATAPEMVCSGIK